MKSAVSGRIVMSEIRQSNSNGNNMLGVRYSSGSAALALMGTAAQLLLLVHENLSQTLQFVQPFMYVHKGRGVEVNLQPVILKQCSLMRSEHLGHLLSNRPDEEIDLVLYRIKKRKL